MLHRVERAVRWVHCKFLFEWVLRTRKYALITLAVMVSDSVLATLLSQTVSLPLTVGPHRDVESIRIPDAGALAADFVRIQQVPVSFVVWCARVSGSVCLSMCARARVCMWV